MKKHVFFVCLCAILIGTLFVSCASRQVSVHKKLGISDEGFPSFITPVDQYYITRIGNVPQIDPDTYRLEVKGLVDHPRSYTLDELYAMDMVDLPLTVECIGNSPNGPLLSTAVWRGFYLYDLLQSLGVADTATGVRYEAADGYYASHTMEQIRDNHVLVALYMNGKPMPPVQGFPVRVLNPGYYGVKQPAWVTSIEVIDRPIKDYWEDRGWDCSPPIAVDSTIFSPGTSATVETNQPLKLTGAAFGGRRIAKVEVTVDGGKTWTTADIVKRRDADNVWVFWESQVTFAKKGSYVVNVRATDIDGNTQIEDDPNRYDGTNDWPMIRVKVN
jgi:DMSO/TMAO reductase YedYZ molybdopterin-dependent catalytic subunit